VSGDLIVDLNVGDCRVVLADYPSDFFDACVTDPPYGIGFMGKEWDTFKPEQVNYERGRARKSFTEQVTNPNLKGRIGWMSGAPLKYDESVAAHRQFQEWTESWAREVYRVLKPGAHLAVFGAPRAHHRMMSGLEDAGFEIRDCLAWLFGQGFPKSLNLKGEWDGWGTALKPAFEPIALARKPVDGTLTGNVAKWGTGALNIDGCRIEGSEFVDRDGEPSADRRYTDRGVTDFAATPGPRGGNPKGRWPANLILDEEAGAMLDAQTGIQKSGVAIQRNGGGQAIFGGIAGNEGSKQKRQDAGYGDTGGASRFFYCPKVSRAEREFGCDSLPARTAGEMTGGRQEGSAGLKNPRAGAGRTSGSRNAHPTVKPIALMRWLVRLVTPPNGLVLDPFVGSGTTGIAAVLEGCHFTGIDGEVEWVTVADARITAHREKVA